MNWLAQAVGILAVVSFLLSYQMVSIATAMYRYDCKKTQKK